MRDGISKVVKRVGCSVEQGIDSLPSFTAGGGYRSITSPKVGYAHFCGDVVVEPYVPPPPAEPEVVVVPSQ